MSHIEIPTVPFTAAQARALGFTPYELRSLVKNRVLRRVLRNVYVRYETPDTTETRAAAARLVVSLASVVCDRTAAWIHGVDVFDYRELDILPPLETFVVRGNTRTRRPETAGGERDLTEDDICVVHGLRVTTPLRTALDLGCRLSRRDALAALDAFLRLHGITVDQLLAELPRYFRRRGVRQLRELLPLVDGRAESSGESWTRLAIIDDGLPKPEPQYWVMYGGRPLFRLDLAYPHARVCVEYDGLEFHEGDEPEMHDEQRREWLERRGWTVIVVDKNSFTDEALAEWLEELRVALGMAI
jgi:hypothetical protein